MNGIDYIDLYYEFQDRFKPVRDFKSLEEIVLKAMQYLVDIMKIHSESDFIKHIHLVYPNYFREVSKGQYQPILDELICFNDSQIVARESFRKRVCQHMGYYLKNDSAGSPDFIRISKSLMENPKARVKDFYVQKDLNSNSQYLLVYNSDFSNKKSIFADPKYPDNLRCTLVRGSLESYNENNEDYKDYLLKYSVEGSFSEAKSITISTTKINDVEGFYNVFKEPLSGHLVLLENSSLLYVYSQTAQIGKDESSLGYGGIFALIDNKLNDQEVLEYIRFFRLIGDNISTCIAHNIMSYKQKNEARKSAKVAIMSRNMSHNLGSHVMSYLKQHLSSVTNMLQDNILTDFLDSKKFEELKAQLENAIQNGNTNPVTFRKDIAKIEDDIALPFLVGLGNFVSYLQERQDFIATIATDYIPYYSTVNFKDFIYDELNPDKRYERHQDRKNFKPDNILLGNIARSEGLGRKISPTEADNARMADIIIKFKNFDGNAVVNNNFTISGREAAYDSLDTMRKINVSLPGGIVGRQAIFSIIENIIRNAAKHGNWRSEGGLELTFDIVDKNDIINLFNEKKELEKKLTTGGSIEEINDTKQKLNEKQECIKDDSVGNHLSLNEVIWLFYSEALDADDLFFFTVTDNIKTKLDDVDSIRKALHEDYIKDDSSMEEGNKGIKELRISAAWLRGAKDESEYYNPHEARIETPQSEKKAPLMYVRLSNPNRSMKEEGHLQYIFCLPVPKMVAIVTSDNSITTINGEVRQKLKSNYWNVFSPKQFKEESNKSYAFVLCDGEACFEEIRPYSSSRIMKLDGAHNIDRDQLFNVLKRGITSEECKSYENKLYEHLAGRGAESEIICIDDKKTKAKIETLMANSQESIIEYLWDPENKETGQGCFVRSDKNVIYGKKDEKTDDVLYDGMRLVPSHNYYKVGNIVITDGGGFGRYVYRTHHDTHEQFKLFMGDLRNNFKGCRFVESITGNTSTDRLVRNDMLNQRWFFSHIRAMKQKVAIFDERLFSKIYGLEEINFTRSKAINGTLDEMKAGYISLFNNARQKDITDCKTIDALDKLINSEPLLRSKLYSSSKTTKGRDAVTYFQKGIYIYTFIKSPTSSTSYDLYGVSVKASEDVLPGLDCDERYCTKCEKLATLSWKDGELVFNSTKFSKNIFDYISIHQGLLDKLYESFGIKNNSDAKDKLTRSLYLSLKSGDNPEGNIINVHDDNDAQREWSFLPGMTIHSGRSKPSKQDMPQPLPFIQYSAIEHATLDCKYSLIELLDNARYEE